MKRLYDEHLSLFLTNMCPCSCSFCLANSGPNKRPVYMSLEIIDKLIWDRKEFRYKHVSLGGGEPTRHPDFTEIVQKFHDAHWDVIVHTNMTNLRKIEEAVKIYETGKNLDNLLVTASFNYDVAYSYPSYASDPVWGLEVPVKYDYVDGLTYTITPEMKRVLDRVYGTYMLCSKSLNPRITFEAEVFDGFFRSMVTGTGVPDSCVKTMVLYKLGKAWRSYSRYPPYPPFQAEYEYYAGDRISMRLSHLECLRDHVSTKLLSPSLQNIKDYVPYYPYKVDMICAYNGSVYRCIEAHTAQPMFDANRFVAEPEDMNDWRIIDPSDPSLIEPILDYKQPEPRSFVNPQYEGLMVCSDGKEFPLREMISACDYQCKL